MAADRGALRRELLVLVALVLCVDGLFIGGYYVAGIATASERVRTVFTVLWTAVTLAVVLRGLGRIRSARVRARSTPRG
jgi:hypothetical protein